MSSLLELSPIRFLDFYLVLLFLASVIRRLDWYRAVFRLVFTIPGRWPNLLNLAKQYHAIFLTWQTMLPAILTFALLVIQLIASRLIWPGAAVPPNGLTLAKMGELWWSLVIAVPFGLAMVGVDFYFLIVIGRIDSKLLQSYFDQAEFWLKSRASDVVRVVTFGFVNPRRIVADEVEKALVDLSKQLNTSLWWIVRQLGLRICFGLSLWLTWAYTMWAGV